MKARLVYDGADEPPVIPPEMGAPKDDQLKGTPREQTAELCGRICYDSLGAGRASPAYHEHIHQVKHYSVYEHTPITVEFTLADEAALLDYAVACLNRPGVFVRILPGAVIRITINHRAVIEWGKTVNGSFNVNTQKAESAIGNTLRRLSHEVAPMIVTDTDGPIVAARRVEPSHAHEKWVTLYMGGSRGFSHEQVRHGDHTAISQRSTRYVDESGSSWVYHPLVEAFLAEGTAASDELRETLGATVDQAKGAYDLTVKMLQPWVMAKMPGDENAPGRKTAARKQARGAARGFLGNALFTEMMFSASVQQWKWMLYMRASQFADAEIREVFARQQVSVISALKESRFADEFDNHKIVPSEDGIGTVVVVSGEDQAAS
jgi:thymidylate synthase ThyX